jgi:general secretion pathway protein F
LPSPTQATPPSHDDVPLPGDGEVVSGSISAPTAAEVSERVEYLGLIPIETVRDEGGTDGARWDFTILSLPRPEDVTVFTGDLALLLQTGARINDALELLSADADIIARCPAPGL